MAPLSEAQRLETLLDLQRDLALEEDIDKVLWRITLAATHLLDADRATLYLIDRERHEIWSRVLADGGAAGLGVGTIDEIRLPLDGRSLAAEVARTGGVLRIDEPYADPRFDPGVDARSGYRTRSILVLPIDSRDRRRLGVLQTVNHRDGAFRAEHERYALTLASSAGIALEYVQLSSELAAERLRVVKVAAEERVLTQDAEGRRVRADDPARPIRKQDSVGERHERLREHGLVERRVFLTPSADPAFASAHRPGISRRTRVPCPRLESRESRAPMSRADSRIWRSPRLPLDA